MRLFYYFFALLRGALLLVLSIEFWYVQLSSVALYFSLLLDLADVMEGGIDQLGIWKTEEGIPWSST